MRIIYSLLSIATISVQIQIISTYFQFSVGLGKTFSSVCKKSFRLLNLKTFDGLVEDNNFISQTSVLIVGGGPAGLASAMVLSQRGCKNVTVLEKRKDFLFDSDRAYMYLIDGRGQRCTNLLNIQQDLIDGGINSLDLYNYTIFNPDKTLKVNRLFVDRTAIAKYWISRSDFMEILNKNVQKDPNIQILHSTTFHNISLSQNGQLLVKASQATASNGSKLLEFEPKLLIGCDGINSEVRTWLSSIDIEGFKPVSFHSDAAGVQYKILKVDGELILNDTIVAPVVAESGKFYTLVGLGKGLYSRNRMGFLPVKGKTRTANINRLAGHEIWKMTNLTCIKQYLQTAFPQVNISRMFSDEVLI
eukprot:gene10675-14336_t